MTLAARFLAEKAELESYLQSPHNPNLPQNQLERLGLLYQLLGLISYENSSTERTPSLTSVTSSGTIPLGARSVSIANIGSAAGTILGTSVDAGMTVNFTAQGSDTLAAITYNATGTNFLIAEVR